MTAIIPVKTHNSFKNIHKYSIIFGVYLQMYTREIFKKANRIEKIFLNVIFDYGFETIKQNIKMNY